MKFSTRAHYGLRAMAELARSYHLGPLSLAEIAQAEGLSLGYLEQLMAKLRRAGLVQATRGVHGGYHLAAPPSVVTVGNVLRALDGPLDPVRCVSEVVEHCDCQRYDSCSSRPVWQKLRDTMAEVLDSTTLADLVPPADVTGQTTAVADKAVANDHLAGSSL
ncbi:MAG: Rrf2 family transcriptional regulator [Chloroflexi bacterium]|nr:Rrf2 family transcriptional regulator [Chloroflexota bacterium]